jgi:prepilin peptidase CpaA
MEFLGFSVTQLCVCLFIALLLAAACSDAKSFIIPNRLNVAVFALYVPYVLSAPTPIQWGMAGIVAGGVLLAGFALFAAGYIGGGDVKLLAATALWAGPEMVLVFVVLTALAGGVLSAAVLLQCRYGWVLGFSPTDGARAVPYGIAIATSGVFVAQQLLTR